MTREEWLNAVAKRLAPAFKKLGHKLPPYRLSIGFTSTGRRGKATGECHASTSSKDGHHEIYIRPDQAASLEVAAILCHELAHCAAGLENGHNRKFRAVALGMGLEGKMRSTVAGARFRELAAAILEDLGDIPHAELSFRRGVGLSDAPKKQSARLLKATCPICGYTLRLARSWAEVARPECPLDREPLEVEGMEAADE
jgi:hypothetical protein